MKSLKLTLIMATLIFIVSTGAAVMAQGCCAMGGPGCPLKLTVEQQKQLAQVRTDFLNRSDPIVAEIRKKKLEMIELASKPKPDEQAIEGKWKEIWGLQDKIVAEGREFSKKARALLTPEQRKACCAAAALGSGCGRGRGCGRAKRGCGIGAFSGGLGRGPGFGRGCCAGGRI